jgi:Tfp pilus assembly PilM family ATPase
LTRSVDTEAAAAHLTAVLDLETTAGELLLLHQGSVVYQRPLIDAGLNQAYARLTAHGLDAEAAAFAVRAHGLRGLDSPQGRKVGEALSGYVRGLIEEATPALDYAGRVYADLPLQRFALVGEAGAVPLLGFELCQQLRLEAATTQPNWIDDHEPDPAYAIALGLALHPEEAAWAAA